MNPADRILDANFNRAREALRVMEDYARFRLEDILLTRAAKELRHRLADAMKALGAAELVAARDIAGDVGQDVKTEAECSRSSLEDVALAAGKRLTEALRSLEEAAKSRSRAVAGALERLRYDAYALEQQFVMRMTQAARFAGIRLYVLLTEAHCRRDWLDTAEAALRGGADVLQLREKELPDRSLLERARRLSSLCRQHGALFMIATAGSSSRC